MSVASFIAFQGTEHRVPHALTCRTLEVSESWFYKWRDRPPTRRQARRAELDAAVKASFEESGGTPGTYGSPGCSRTWSRPAGGCQRTRWRLRWPVRAWPAGARNAGDAR
jgi:hypothetical protein